VAVERRFLRAHERDAAACRDLFHPFEAGAKRGKPRDTLVGGHSVFIGFALGAARAEFLPEEKVADAARGQRRLERLAAELRVARARRHGTHVRDPLDAVFLEERDEVLERMIRVADGVEGVGHWEARMKDEGGWMKEYRNVGRWA